MLDNTAKSKDVSTGANAIYLTIQLPTPCPKHSVTVGERRTQSHLLPRHGGEKKNKECQLID